MKPAIITLIIGLGVGLLITAQFKSPRQRILNPVEPVVSLTDTRANLTEKATRLKEEIKLERERNAAIQDELKRNRKNTQGLIEEFNQLKADVGLTEIKDRGVVLTLADDAGGELDIDSIVHAADLRDAANVLWQAGAKAIAINDERLAAPTSIDSIINTVLVNNTRIANPFVIKAAGEPKTLAEAVEFQDNLQDLHRRRKNAGLIFNVERAKEVTIPAFSGSFEIKFAKIAP